MVDAGGMRRTRASASQHLTRAASLTLGLGVAALLAELVLIVIGSGSSELRAGLATTASFAAGAAIVLRGVGKPAGQRAPWIVLGLGGLSYSLARSSSST
jgi:peptidoglycan/LPS O-acetylase OafA/YrhL